jgi:hypothetical protein
MEPYTLITASEAARKSKSTILRAIQKGRLSAARTENGGWLIDPSELARVYPSVVPPVARFPLSPGNGEVTDATSLLRVQLEAAERRIADKEAQLTEAREQIIDLRHRLDRADERLTALLTDQRAAPPRRWWRWRRV